MSGHSHFATIKRQKETKDAAKGKIFSKMGRAISIAVKTGGGGDPAANYKLRMAIDLARAVNMPRENIDRAISRASAEGHNLEEVTYEGFGPGGVGILVEVATDNRNRTAQEMKSIFDRGGGNLAGPGSVAFNFDPKGLIVVKKTDKPDEQILSIIDIGVDDIEDSGSFFSVFVGPANLAVLKDKLIASGFVVDSFSLTQKPKSFVTVNDISTATKIYNLLETFDDHDDVLNVYSNFDIPDSIKKEMEQN